ncbi:peptidase M4 [uncultured Meiothermus sp.]|jgi:hypothetical protein|uniref:peptidase M4 n=1 Tax=uncultured Meiothermus sp. TaxID=157471 RepID=UPI00260700B0|nr:peptidase M4 [uncultured Meiothermus sp.]
MKRGMLWLGVAGLLVLGVAFTQGNRGYGGMMGADGQGLGMMGQGMMGGGMGMMAVYPAQAQPTARAEAKTRLETYAKRFGPDARLKDFMAFSQNYYAQVVDAKGRGLGEILADRYTGNVYLEPGPNMMWGTRSGPGYGGTGRGMMGGPGLVGSPSASAEQYDLANARRLAEQFLQGYLPGAKVLEAQSFQGYFTFDYGRRGLEGMLSVSAYGGQIWVHTWHGVFLGE